MLDNDYKFYSSKLETMKHVNSILNQYYENVDKIDQLELDFTISKYKYKENFS